MNKFEVTEPTLKSLLEKPKMNWWAFEAETKTCRVNAVDVEGGFGVERFAMAENLADPGGLISAA
jgi:hypothetical protein